MTHSDELVERVARAIRQQYEAEYEEDPGDWWCEQLARAALSAMPGHELRIGDFVLRPAGNGIWIGRDGEGGEFAAEHVERVIAQFYRENF